MIKALKDFFQGLLISQKLMNELKNRKKETNKADACFNCEKNSHEGVFIANERLCSKCWQLLKKAYYKGLLKGFEKIVSKREIEALVEFETKNKKMMF